MQRIRGGSLLLLLFSFGKMLTLITGSSLPKNHPGSVAIVGGGLAGVSVAYHLLARQPRTNITVFDKADPGMGGASAVAGG